MTLFSALSVSAKAPAPPSPSTEDLQKKLADIEAAVRIRRKYGQGCTDEAVAFYITEEEKLKAKKEMKAAAEAQGRIEAEKRKKEIEAAAVTLNKEGRLIVTVNQVRVTIDKECRAPCPHCGGGLVHSYEPIYEYAKRWHTTPPDQRFGAYSELLVRSAKNPISWYMGQPLWMSSVKCHSCEKTAYVAVALVII